MWGFVRRSDIVYCVCMYVCVCQCECVHKRPVEVQTIKPITVVTLYTSGNNGVL